MAYEDMQREYVFKKVLGREHTTLDATWDGEPAGGGLLLPSHLIWQQSGDIPSTPPGVTSLIVEVYDRIQLTLDTAIEGKRCWRAKDPTQLRNFIPPMFGSGYNVQLSEDLTGSVPVNIISIPWVFDYENGVLSFVGDQTFTTLYLKCYRYAGLYGAGGAAGAWSSIGNDLYYTAGKVGIGIIPGYLLDLKQSGTGYSTTASPTPGIRLLCGDVPGSYSSIMLYARETDAGTVSLTAFSGGLNGSAGLAITTRHSYVTSEKFRINSDGGVCFGQRFGAFTGAPSSTIFAISPTYSTYGLFYNSGSPDRIELKWAGAIKRRWNFETGSVEVLPKLSGTGIQPRVYRDVASYSEMAGGLTGWMLITLPHGWTNTMLQFRVKGYDYSPHGAWEVVICGYTYATGANWYNARIDIVYDDPPFSHARLGITSTGKCAVALGEGLNTVWTYPTIIISEVIAGYSSVEDWDDGWTIARSTNLTGFTLKKAIYFSPDMTELHKNWVPCIFMGQRDPLNSRYIWDDFSVANKGLTDFYTFWDLPLPGTRGDETLYIDAVKVVVRTADSNDFVDQVTIMRMETDPTLIAQTSTNMNSRKHWYYYFTEATVGGGIRVMLDHNVTGVHNLRISSVALRCHYKRNIS